jgi:ABC-type polysaccharide/polyol phosphate transport system ATPase subunit
LSKGMEPRIVFTVAAIFMPSCMCLDTQIPLVLFIICVQD